MGRTQRVLLAGLSVATGVGGLVLLRYNSELRKARDAARSGGLIADTIAGPIEYAETSAGIPLFSIHGAGGGYDQGLANVANLVGGGLHVIAPSRFGYLRTRIPRDASPAAQADAHAALLSELNTAPAIVVGYSAGARSAVELAIRHPDQVVALILIVPGTHAPTSLVSVEAPPVHYQPPRPAGILQRADARTSDKECGGEPEAGVGWAARRPGFPPPGMVAPERAAGDPTCTNRCLPPMGPIPDGPGVPKISKIGWGAWPRKIAQPTRLPRLTFR